LLTPEVCSDSDQTIPNSCEESEDEFQCSNSENSDSDLSEESEHETKEEKDPCEDPKTQALVEMQEMQKKSVFYNKLARASIKLQGKKKNDTESNFKKIWKDELTTLDRINLVKFYNERNSKKQIEFDKTCINTLDLNKDDNQWEKNKKNLSKIISWSINKANLENNKILIERRIFAAKESSERFRGTSSEKKGEIEEGVKQFLQNPRPEGVVLNPIAKDLLIRFAEKEK